VSTCPEYARRRRDAADASAATRRSLPPLPPNLARTEIAAVCVQAIWTARRRVPLDRSSRCCCRRRFQGSRPRDPQSVFVWPVSTSLQNLRALPTRQKSSISPAYLRLDRFAAVTRPPLCGHRSNLRFLGCSRAVGAALVLCCPVQLCPCGRLASRSLRDLRAKEAK